MAFPTPNDEFNMGYSFNGDPFIEVPGNSTITLTNMSFVLNAQPFVRNSYGATTKLPYGSLATKLIAGELI